MLKKHKLAYYGALQDRAIAKLRKMPRAQRELLTTVTRLQLQTADLSEKLTAATAAYDNLRNALPPLSSPPTTSNAFKVIEANIVDRQTRIGELRTETRQLVEEVENLQLEAARLGRG